MSPAVISRLTAAWQADYDAWQKRARQNPAALRALIEFLRSDFRAADAIGRLVEQ